MFIFNFFFLQNKAVPGLLGFMIVHLDRLLNWQMILYWLFKELSQMSQGKTLECVKEQPNEAHLAETHENYIL